MEDEKLEKIEEYSSLFLTIEDIALMIDVETEWFLGELSDLNSAVSKAYRRGRLQTEIEQRRRTKMFAEKGSPQADAQMIEYAIRQKVSEAIN
jgi:hypothetical protein